MRPTLEGFCRLLLATDTPEQAGDPERMASAFVRYFRLSGRPDTRQLVSLFRSAGFGTVSARDLDGLRGIHYSAPGGSYDIHFRPDLWTGAQDSTVLHEAYEIIRESLGERPTTARDRRQVCREADRFAAAVLMPPETFARAAERTGLDVSELQRAYRCSYAAVTMRLTEVLTDQPLMAVLYERAETGDPMTWAPVPTLRATVVRRTRGFGTPATPALCGHGRTVPRPGRSPASGSLAAEVARCARALHAKEDGYAIVARPIAWKGRLAKVGVIAVPGSDLHAIAPQLERLRLGTAATVGRLYGRDSGAEEAP